MGEIITMTADAILKEIKPLGTENYRKVLLNHGVGEPCYGVKIGDLKKVQKRVEKDYQLALDLYETGVYDAMYLAGLIADDDRMTKRDLRRWVKKARGPLAGSTVAWVAAESRYGMELAREWIESDKDFMAESGWATLCCLVALKADAELDLRELEGLLQRAENAIHDSPDDVRYQMNGFVISVGCYVEPLSKAAIKVAKRIGRVQVDMGNTACKVPVATEMIGKVIERGSLGKKRKTVKC